MLAGKALSWLERSVLRRATYAESMPRGLALFGYLISGVVIAWLLRNAWLLWASDRDAASVRLAGAATLLFVAGVAAYLNASLQLLARFGVSGLADAPTPRVVGNVGTRGAEGLPLARLEARRLAEAHAFAGHLDRLPWLYPILMVATLVPTGLALYLVDIPRPLALWIAGVCGFAVGAAFTGSRVPGWIRLVLELERRGASAR